MSAYIALAIIALLTSATFAAMLHHAVEAMLPRRSIIRRRRRRASRARI